MNYMAVSTPGPQTCPGVHAPVREQALAGLPRLEQVMRDQGCSHQGTWISRTGHVSYSLVDAPDAHTLEDALAQMGLASWNTISIYPVISLADAMEQLAQM